MSAMGEHLAAGNTLAVLWQQRAMPVARAAAAALSAVGARMCGRRVCCPHLHAERRLGCHCSAQHVTGGQVAEAVLVLDDGGLGALPTAGRAWAKRIARERGQAEGGSRQLPGLRASSGPMGPGAQRHYCKCRLDYSGPSGPLQAKGEEGWLEAGDLEIAARAPLPRPHKQHRSTIMYYSPTRITCFCGLSWQLRRLVTSRINSSAGKSASSCSTMLAMVAVFEAFQGRWRLPPRGGA